MFDKKELCEFLVKAKKNTYAAGDTADKIINSDNSTTITFEEGSWKYHDNYFGGEPYGGREVVFFEDKPVYIMTYYGQVCDCVTDVKDVYKVLMNALKLIPVENPYRGPNLYIEESFEYKNEFSGKIDNFYGEEVILKGNVEIYNARYAGGFVDMKN